MQRTGFPDIVSTFENASNEMLGAVLDQSVDCIKVIGLDGSLEYMNHNGQCTMEIDDFSSVSGALWWELWPDDSAHLVRSAFERGMAGESHRFRGFCPTAKGSPRWWDVSVSPLRDSHGELRGLVSISRDVSEQVRLEELRNATADEMRHRLQNAYTLSGAILMAAAKGSSDRQAFAAEVLDRLNQLSIAQSLLLDPSRLGDLALQTLVTKLTEPFSASECALEIPRLREITLDDPQARTLALVLGELSTNSNKYGALRFGGAIGIEGSAEGRELNLRWSERSRNQVSATSRDGANGFRLIQRALSAQGGSFAVHWLEDGLDAHVVLPVVPR